MTVWVDKHSSQLLNEEQFLSAYGGKTCALAGEGGDGAVNAEQQNTQPAEQASIPFIPRVLLSNLAPSITDAELRSFLASYDVQPFLISSIIPNDDGTKAAFATFGTCDEAETAKAMLQEQTLLGNTLDVRMSRKGNRKAIKKFQKKLEAHKEPVDREQALKNA